MIGLGRSTPVVPWEINDEVELYARENGRHGKVEWNGLLNCFVIILSLKADDPQMRAWQEGTLKQSEPPNECIDLVQHDGTNYVPINLYELGAGGIRNFLERGNTFSGRGEFTSIEDAVKKARAQVASEKEKVKNDGAFAARKRAAENRRQIENIPYLPVGIDLKEK